MRSVSVASLIRCRALGVRTDAVARVHPTLHPPGLMHPMRTSVMEKSPVHQGFGLAGMRDRVAFEWYVRNLRALLDA